MEVAPGRVRFEGIAFPAPEDQPEIRSVEGAVKAFAYHEVPDLVKELQVGCPLYVDHDSSKCIGKVVGAEYAPCCE